MDTHIDLATGRYPVTLEEIRKELLTVSLPKNPTEHQLRKCGYCPVVPTAKPDGTGVVENYPRYVDGRFYQTWDVVESVDINVWRRELKQQLDRTYQKALTHGYHNDSYRLDLTDSESLNWLFLECLFLREENSTATVDVQDRDGGMMEVSWEEGLHTVKQAIGYRRNLKRRHTVLLAAIRSCRTVDECKVVKRQIENEELFQC